MLCPTLDCFLCEAYGGTCLLHSDGTDTLGIIREAMREAYKFGHAYGLGGFRESEGLCDADNKALILFRELKSRLPI